MTDGEAPQTPPPARPGWRTHPLAKRLPVLLLLALGLWLWKVTTPPTREVVWQFDGYGWGEVRAIDFQVMDPQGTLVEREERFFGPAGPPPELRAQWDLPPGTYRALLFIKREGRATRERVEEPLTVGEEQYVLRKVRLPADR
ncbi:hypothetical protein P2318_17345 [Myxococcaceae bacterium GXIMD 01537]